MYGHCVSHALGEELYRNTPFSVSSHKGDQKITFRSQRGRSLPLNIFSRYPVRLEATLANVQAQFDAFHETIKLKSFGENQELREKRDIIRKKLEKQLPGVFEAHGETCPAFHFRDQGSYEMHTGTKPLDDDFDIDQGLYFEVSTDDYLDPIILKQRVHEALDGHTKDVRIRRPCVTVTYQRDGESLYHVDIAVYSDGSKNTDGKSRLAKGRLNSLMENRVWEVSDPERLTETIFARFTETDRRQFRHVVRYLKRWRDENFPSNGNAAPLGIGLTVATYDHLTPAYIDRFAGKTDDLKALRSVVDGMLGQFSLTWGSDAEQWVRRLTVKLPADPWSDLFVQMTDTQMERFESKLKQLQEALDAAEVAVDPVEASETLRKVLGSDFPVPAKQETAKYHAPAIVSSSNSA